MDVIFLHNSKKKMQRAVGERMGKGKNKLDNTFFPVNGKNQNLHSANQELHMQNFHTKDKAIANALILIKCKKVEHLVVEGLVDPCSQMLLTT